MKRFLCFCDSSFSRFFKEWNRISPTWIGVPRFLKMQDVAVLIWFDIASGSTISCQGLYEFRGRASYSWVLSQLIQDQHSIWTTSCNVQFAQGVSKTSEGRRLWETISIWSTATPSCPLSPSVRISFCRIGRRRRRNRGFSESSQSQTLKCFIVSLSLIHR